MGSRLARRGCGSIEAPTVCGLTFRAVLVWGGRILRGAGLAVVAEACCHDGVEGDDIRVGPAKRAIEGLEAVGQQLVGGIDLVIVLSAWPVGRSCVRKVLAAAGGLVALM